MLVNLRLFNPGARRLLALLLSASLSSATVLPLSAASAPATLEGPPEVYAITGAKIVPVSGKPIEKGSIVFRDGIILAVGENVQIPADAKVVEGAGLTIYPALINAATRLGMPGAEEYPTGRGDGYPVVAVQAERNAVSLMKPDSAAAGELQKLGFGAALTAPYVGLFSGSSAVISLGEASNPAELVLRAPVAMHLQFFAESLPDAGRYPGSLMGNIAVTRQALMDARGAAERLNSYASNPSGKPRPQVSRAVSALIPVVEKKLPLVARAEGGTDIRRMLDLCREFGIKPIIAGATEAYKTIAELKSAGASVLLSAELPQMPRVPEGEEDPSTLQGLRRRALVPTNAAKLAQAGVPFALTTEGMERAGDFSKNIRAMIAAGLTEEQALLATTLAPAKLLGVDRQLGSLEAGKIANVLVVEGGSLFSGKAKIRHLFIDGKQIKTAGADTPAANTGSGRATGPAASIASSLPPGVTPEQALQFLRQNPAQARQFLPAGVTVEMAIAALEGKSAPEGEQKQETAKAEVIAAPPAVGEGLIPPLPPAAPAALVLRGATIWTSGPQGKLENADLYIRDGRIQAVGAGLKVPGGTAEVDARGKHITPGMIDCHSHTAIDGGVNEGSNIVTAECRIQDVIDPEDVNIYRQLAGGTTAANLLHGSANAIGGQNAVVKWRWGADARGLMLEGAPEGIKFALGENPTRSNGGIPSSGTRRYPATRMGVERVIRAKFLEARDYQAQQNAYKQGRVPVPPRQDFQLDAIVEILEGKRLVHCHSYRADEILMMVRLADEFGFRIATFQHVLEGYKVADELAKHGAGGSTFSDWWGFKLEAYDAIPYNGALMSERGVLTSFNSDSTELARRLNLEAAKAVRYGGMAPEEALKLVTLNPAKQLGIEKKIGSLEPGKDADLVVWSGDPLSTLTICEKTFVDGKLYFDRAADLTARAALEAEKTRLKAALNPKKQGDAEPETKSEAKPGEAGEVGFQRGGPRPGRIASTPEPPAVSGPVTAFVGATVHPISAPAIADGVVVVQGGKIIAVGPASSVTIPATAKQRDLRGKHIYPGLIDADTTLGVNEIGSRRETQDYQELGDFMPELRTAVAINPDAETLRVARSAGILNAVVCPAGGIISGTGALTQLDGWTWEEMAIQPVSGLYLNFPTMGFRRFRETAHRCEETAGSGHEEAEHDPVFRSGAYVPADSHDTEALRYGLLPRQRGRRGQRGAGGEGGNGEIPENLRRTNEFLEDARRYQKAKQAEGAGILPPLVRDVRLEAMLPALEGKLPLFLRADREKDIRSAVAWAKKQGLKMVLLGGQEADKCSDLLVREKIPVVLGPVMNLPGEQDAPYDDAYTLPARLAKAGVKFCLSTGDAQDVRRLPQQAAMAASYGLAPEEALKAVTLYPAQILGAGDRLGSIEVGKDANLLITTGSPLEITSVLEAAYIAGQPVDLSNRQTRLYDRWKSRPKP